MWVCYGSALASALRFGYLMALRGVSDSFQYFATIVVSIQVTIIGLCFAGPVFNTQLGIVFWTVTAALLGAAQSWQEMEAPAAVATSEASTRASWGWGPTSNE